MQGTIDVVTVLALIFLGITGPLVALLETMDLGVMLALKRYGFSFAILIMDLHFSWNLLYTLYIYPKLHHQPRPPKTGRALINGKYQLWVCIALLALLWAGFEVFFIWGDTFAGCLLICYTIYFLVIKKWDS